MDLKVYYQKLRQVEQSITEPHVVLVSQETPDGGRAGVPVEAPRSLAAKLIVEGAARLATEQEAEEYHARSTEARRKAEQAAAASRIQVTVIAEQPEDGKKQRTKGKGPQD